MHVAEFLNRTNRRNINSQIAVKVQRQLITCLKDLQQRRLQLAEQLQRETSQVNMELAELRQAQVDAAQNERIEWIRLALMRQEHADEVLIKQKKLQREIENSEEHRHMETRELLLDTKQAQLYQIEESRARRRLSAYMDKQWQLS